MFHESYTNKRVLVTGHTGFKGSWLCHWLLLLGAEVAGFSLSIPSNPSNFEALRLSERLHKDVRGDVRDSTQLRCLFEDFQPEFVFHLAAQPIVRRSYKESKLTFDTNLGGIVNLLEILRHSSSVRAAVLITSDKCYDNQEWEYGYRETDRLGGRDPYSASKACAEIAFSAYFHSFFAGGQALRLATTRAGNVIGGGDWAEDRIVPDCIRAWSRNASAKIRNPKATRPWQHVLEPLSGYLWLGSKLYQGHPGLSGEAFNFGPSTEVTQSVSELIEEMKKTWPEASWEVNSTTVAQKHEASLLKLCCDKAMTLLHWQPALTFGETVRMTGEWYFHYYHHKGDRINFTSSQIRHYEQLAYERGREWTRL